MYGTRLRSARKRQNSPNDDRPDEQAARRSAPRARVTADEEDGREVGDDDPEDDTFADEEEDGGESEEGDPDDDNLLAEEKSGRVRRRTEEDSPDPFAEDQDVVDFEDEEFTDESAIESQSEDEAPQRPSSVTGGKATAAQKQRKLDADFAELPTELQTVAQHHSAKLARAASSSKAFISKHRGEIESMRVLEDWIPTAQEEIEAGVWTQDEEGDFQRRIRDDPYLAYLRGLTVPPGNKGFLPMWKKICRLRRCFPTWIISPRNHLEYDGRVALADGTEVADPVWTRGFCDRLARLALGGPWGGNMTLLALFVRYAVACRINDRGAVPFAHGTDSWFMEEMRARLRTGRDGSKSIPQIHKEVRRAAGARSLDVPWYSLVMRNIEKLAYDKETPAYRGAGGRGPAPYRVRTEDLHRVERAVHHCKDLGMPMFASLGDRARVLSHGWSYDLPKTVADVRHLLILIQVAWERRRRIEQIRPPTPTPPRGEFPDPGASSDAGRLGTAGYDEDFGGPGDSPLPGDGSDSEGSGADISAPRCDLPLVFPIPGMEGLETSKTGGGATFTIRGLKGEMLPRPTAREEQPDVIPQLALSVLGLAPPRARCPKLDSNQLSRKLLVAQAYNKRDETYPSSRLSCWDPHNRIAKEFALAVHSRKVAGVRRRLEDVMAGQMRQRLLILKVAGTGKTTAMLRPCQQGLCQGPESNITSATKSGNPLFNLPETRVKRRRCLQDYLARTAKPGRTITLARLPRRTSRPTTVAGPDHEGQGGEGKEDDGGSKKNKTYAELDAELKDHFRKNGVDM
ncbi:hypothetical protein DL771_007232 [Monosporascus sp. 5C6A]|nr:hypothetical protein DL771_007232 [Monosporascus sp. 5C6A]